MQTNCRYTRRFFSHPAIVIASSFLALVAAPADSSAQTYWRAPAAAGGAFVGAGIGWAIDIAAWGGRDLGGPALNMTPVGIGLGAVVGFIGGLSADRHLARGQTLARGTRASLRTALFLTPVAIGSAAAFAIINPSDDGECVPDPNIGCTYQPPPRKAMPDEAVALFGIGGGVLVGLLAQHKFAGALWPKTRVNVAPTGRGVVVSIPVGW